METSAKDDINVEEAIVTTVALLKENANKLMLYPVATRKIMVELVALFNDRKCKFRPA